MLENCLTESTVPDDRSMARPAERPIFVVGAPRSGTTMLRYMLCGHPRIYIPPESNFIPRFFNARPLELMGREQATRTLKQILGYRTFFRDWREEKLDPEAFINRLPDLTPRTLLTNLYARYARQFGAERWGDKSPIYTVHMELLAEIFPGAQFVHIIRDARDVALSMLKAYQGVRFFYIDIFFGTHSWKRRVGKARESGARLGPGRYQEVYYEKLIANPESQLRKICDFLQEAYSAGMVEPNKVAEEHHHSKGIHAATRRSVMTVSAGRWQKEMSASNVRLVQTLAGDVLQELGYEIVDVGGMSFEDLVRYAALRIKYSLVEIGRRALQAAGIFHPATLLDSLKPSKPRSVPRASRVPGHE